MTDVARDQWANCGPNVAPSLLQLPLAWQWISTRKTLELISGAARRQHFHLTRRVSQISHSMIDVARAYQSRAPLVSHS